MDAVNSEDGLQSWTCVVCGLVYDEAAGVPNELAPGTRWAHVPDDWVCPDCGAGKAHFEPVTC